MASSASETLLGLAHPRQRETQRGHVLMIFGIQGLLEARNARAISFLRLKHMPMSNHRPWSLGFLSRAF